MGLARPIFNKATKKKSLPLDESLSQSQNLFSQTQGNTNFVSISEYDESSLDESLTQAEFVAQRPGIGKMPGKDVERGPSNV